MLRNNAYGFKSKFFSLINPHAPDRFNPPPHALVAQKIADQRWLIANSAKIGTFLYKWCDYKLVSVKAKVFFS